MEWKPEQDALLLELRGKGLTFEAIGKVLGATSDACNGRHRRLLEAGAQPGPVAVSPYPKFDQPLELHGDAVILPDVELPFHHAPFLNRVLDLADAWGVKQAIVAGDLLHFHSLSAWEPSWLAKGSGGMDPLQRDRVLERVAKLPARHQGPMLAELSDLIQGGPSGAPNASTELGIARREVKRLAEQFERIDYVVGNHDGRLLRALNSALLPDELLVQLLLTDDPRWRIAPYYFSKLHSGGETYVIEHPKGAGANEARLLADKYQAHTLVAHVHRVSMTWSRSGRYMACEIGCLVDEDRLAYAAQRHNSSQAHKLGAAIVNDGYAHLLHDRVDWAALRRMHG